ncbi:reverse transcriptase domain-containing protein [Tanacetum coccineum]
MIPSNPLVYNEEQRILLRSMVGLHEEQRISDFVHGLRTQSLVEHLSTDLPSAYKGLMEKAYTWVEAREVATNGISNNRRDDFERSKKFSWGNNIGQKDRGRFSPYKDKLLSNLVKNYGYETNQCRELKHQIEEVVKSGQLAHLVKGVKEKKEKTTGTRSEERKKEEKKPTLGKVSVLMISEKNRNMKKRLANHGGIGEITFPPRPNVGSSDPVIIKVYISGRQVNRVYLDGGSSCEVIYEHCFLKLKPSIRSLRVDSNTPLIGFSREQSWPLGEIPLEVTIGEGLITVTKTLTFVIIKSDSPHNLLLGRTAMQQIGIVVSTVHGAIKFHTPRGIGTIFSEYNAQKPKEEEDGPTNKYQGNEENVLSCIDTEERVVINDYVPQNRC